MMDVLKSLFLQLRRTYANATPSTRITAIVATVLCLLFIGSVGYWSSLPQYQLLAQDLSPEQSGAIIDKLQAANIQFQTSFSGAMISVPTTKWSTASVEIRGIVDSKKQAEPGLSFWGGAGLDPESQRFRLLREKERLLELSISQLRGIEEADVHIAVPDKTPFKSQMSPTTAAILLIKKPDARISKEQASAIANTIARSVDHLAVEDITITDDEGRQLWPLNSGAGGMFGNFEFRREVEADLAGKAERMLELTLGPGKALVTVTADINFSQTTRNEQLIDPNKIVRQETISSQDSKTNSRANGGVAGAGSNLNPGFTNGANQPSSETVETITSVYDTSKEMTETVEPAGQIKRITASVIVELPDPASTPAVPALSTVEIEQIVKNAIGFDANRGDEITVHTSKLTPATEFPVVTLDEDRKWNYYSEVAKNSSLGLAAVCALVTVSLVLRKVKPVKLGSDSDRPSRDERIASIADQINRNPEAVAKVLSVWGRNAKNQVQADPTTGTNRRAA